MLFCHAEQEASAHEAHHRQPLTGAEGHLGFHDKGIAGQASGAGQEIELAKAAQQPEHEPEKGQQQKYGTKGLNIAAPGKGTRSKGR